MKQKYSKAHTCAPVTISKNKMLQIEIFENTNYI